MQKGTEKKGKAVIGVSLGCKLFTKDWIRLAIMQLSERHESILFVLADELLRYTRSAHIVEDRVELEIQRTSSIITERSKEWAKCILSERNRVVDNGTSLIQVRKWADFSDNSYCNLLRNFRSVVDDVARAHISLLKDKAMPHITTRLDAMFILDEIAMCLRVTELDEYHFEYYPSEEIEVLTQMYRGEFKSSGLTVEALTGVSAKRKFQILPLCKHS